MGRGALGLSLPPRRAVPIVAEPNRIACRPIYLKQPAIARALLHVRADSSRCAVTTFLIDKKANQRGAS